MIDLTLKLKHYDTFGNFKCYDSWNLYKSGDKFINLPYSLGDGIITNSWHLSSQVTSSHIHYTSFLNCSNVTSLVCEMNRKEHCMVHHIIVRKAMKKNQRDHVIKIVLYNVWHMKNKNAKRLKQVCKIHVKFFFVEDIYAKAYSPKTIKKK